MRAEPPASCRVAETTACMKIEKIEQSKHGQERVLVHLEGEETLRITKEELLRFDLYTGLDISPEAVVELKKSAARSETRLRAVNMVSARALSKKELTKRLRDKGAEEADADAAADWLEDIGALDDAAYAKTIVRHYSAKGYGAAKYRDELFRRGVPREYWEEALASAPPAEEIATRVAAERTKGKPMDDRERKRISDLLLRRGFSWSEIRPALEALGAEMEEE